MRWTRLTISLLALAAFVGPSAGSALATAPAVALQWSGLPMQSDGIAPERPFVLRNTTVRRPLGFGDRTFGVDLVWSHSGNWVLLRGANDHRNPKPAIDPSERVALYNQKARKYLGWGPTSFGIDLAWHSTPRREWQVSGNGTRAALYGVASNENGEAGRRHYLVYQEQTTGINLGFVDGGRPECDAPPAADQYGRIGLASAPSPYTLQNDDWLNVVGQGLQDRGQIPNDSYNCYRATIVGLHNPPNRASMVFRNASSPASIESCGDPASVVVVRPGLWMTPAELTSTLGANRDLRSTRISVCASKHDSPAVFPSAVDVRYQLR